MHAIAPYGFSITRQTPANLRAEAVGTTHSVVVTVSARGLTDATVELILHTGHGKDIIERQAGAAEAMADTAAQWRRLYVD